VLQAYQETRRRFFDHPAVRIEGAAARAARNCRTPQALTPQLQIVLTLRGAFVYERGSSHSLLTANHALFIGAGDVSRDRFVDDQPLDYMLVTPQVDAVAVMVGDEVAEGFAKLARETRVTGASARLQRAASVLWRAGCRNDVEIEQSVIELLTCIVHAAGLELRTRTAAADKLIGAAKELIGTAREPQSLTHIAAQLDVSPAYLTDLFRRHEGLSIARYQRRLRLSRALLELPETADIAALALDLGFSSHAHFTTAFRATYGETPSTYRRRMTSKESESAS
jgi:Transcriptional regulator containing an amidase domain and an AraC-type DNA-binding HTH domain